MGFLTEFKILPAAVQFHWDWAEGGRGTGMAGTNTSLRGPLAFVGLGLTIRYGQGATQLQALGLPASPTNHLAKDPPRCYERTLPP